MKLTATHHVGLFTPNFDAMKHFYSETLGLEIVRSWDEPQIVFFAAGSTLIELVDKPDAAIDEARPAGFDHFAFHVDDVDAAFDELKEAGVRTAIDPKDFQDVRIAFFYDPDGNMLELVQDPR